MAHPRPKLSTGQGNKDVLTLPAGWKLDLTGVSKQTYNQLAVVEYPFFGDTESRYLASKWQSQNKPMTDVDTGRPQLSLLPQDDVLELTLSYYYSQSRTISGRKLQDDKYRCSSRRPVVENKPMDAPADVRDYMNITLFVQDSQQTANQGEDFTLTIRMEYTIDEPAIDTGTAAISEQGKAAIQAFLDRYIRPGDPYPTPPPPYTPPPNLANLPVGIIGAGVSGLYIGMMLDSLGIKYEIMEGSERIGGRLYTHFFPKNGGPYQYYDVGAMRYPNTTFMRRTFDLVNNRLNMSDKFIKYIRANENAFLCYNDVTVTKQENASKPASADVFKVSQANGGNVPPDYVAKGSGQMWDEALKELRELFVTYPFEKAYKELMKFDTYSVRTFLTQAKGYPSDVVNWFEGAESRTGLLDEALTETVLASLVFNDPNYAGRTIDWYCLDGGSEVVHKAMTAQLKTKPVLYQRATAIEESDDGNSITVTFDGRRNPNPAEQRDTQRKYSNVISTMSFACLRMVDLSKAGLNYGQKNAIRDLMYTPSIKVGIQFKRPWWEDLGIVGGQSSTDLPIRDVVYPSYGPDNSHPVKGSKSNCMIASYNGMQDSQRLAGLMKGRDTPEERAMLDLIMRNLAQLHRVPVGDIWKEYEDHYPWDFHHDSFQLGAFCQFGPGQFKYVYPYMTQPASSKQRLHFAGDAASCFHGWVAGALNSAWRAVLGMLIAHPELNPNKNEDIVSKFIEKWGGSEEWDAETLANVVNVGRGKN